MHPGSLPWVPRGVVRGRSRVGELSQISGTHPSNQLATAVVTLPGPGQQRYLTSGRAERSSEREKLMSLKRRTVRSKVFHILFSKSPEP